MKLQTEEAFLGAGCFWCVEAIFQRLKGVQKTISGYAGGDIPRPDYRLVCSGSSGHAEVCQISFDPQKLSYGSILEVFWNTHDPTSLNRQGADEGTQYRSVIFYCNQKQKEIAEESLELMENSGIFSRPIVTQITPLPLDGFYPAESYHQNYYQENPKQPYCSFLIQPKIEKLEEKFPRLIR